jgi:putative oxidoreductase
MINAIVSLHNTVFGAVQRATEDWLPGLLARFVFAAVLLVYFLNSASKKVGEGLTGFLTVTDNAYFQILPPVVEAYGYDASQIPLIPWDIIVYLGTYSEFILPTLIVIGLLTRVAALGMIVFVLVQSYVDIAFHGVDAETIGAWFDRLSGAVIMDQRALWVFLLAYLVIRGPGKVSIDYLFHRGR